MKRKEEKKKKVRKTSKRALLETSRSGFHHALVCSRRAFAQSNDAGATGSRAAQSARPRLSAGSRVYRTSFQLLRGDERLSSCAHTARHPRTPRNVQFRVCNYYLSPLSLSLYKTLETCFSKTRDGRKRRETEREGECGTRLATRLIKNVSMILFRRENDDRGTIIAIIFF